MSDERAKWINELAGEYVEDWVGEQVADVWQKEVVNLQARIEELEADVGSLITRIADERSKTLEQMRNERIKELGSEIATQQARIEALEPLLRDAIHRIGDEGFDAIWKKQARALLEGSKHE